MRKEVLNETKFIQEIVAVLPIVICFQSLILDMAGNVGTLVPMFSIRGCGIRIVDHYSQ